MPADLTALIAKSLKISADQVADDLSYESIEQWDSLGHVNLMLSIESEYDVEIDEDTMIELTSVRAIRDYVAQHA
jgi:citrate synthase